MSFNYTSTTDYTALLFELLKNVEGVKRFAYYDQSNTNDPTMGIGFNLTDDRVLDATLKAMGFDLDGTSLNADTNLIVREKYYRDQIQTIVNSGQYSTDIELQTALDQVMSNRLNDTFYQSYPAVELRFDFGFSVEPEGSDEMQQVLTVATKFKEDLVDDWLTKVVGEDPLLSLNSKERAVLVSLAYNSRLAYNKIAGQSLPTLLGNNLAKAIREGDRTEAWFEIRYNSNSATQSASVRGGLAKRRYYESQLFGLYDANVTSASVNEQQAKEVYRMFTVHRKTILNYETNYGEGKTGTANKISAANSD